MNNTKGNRMRTTICTLPVLLPLVLISGCATTYDVSSLQPPSAHRPDCVANSGNRVKVVADKWKIRVAPPNLCIRNFTASLTIQVSKIPRDTEVEVHEKKGDPATWLRGTRTGPGHIRIDVPDEADNRVYEYYISIAGFGVIDPMVSVER